MDQRLMIAIEVGLTVVGVVAGTILIAWLAMGSAVDIPGVLATLVMMALVFAVLVLPVSWVITRAIVSVGRVASRMITPMPPAARPR
jgi:hypothetical protein